MRKTSTSRPSCYPFINPPQVTSNHDEDLNIWGFLLSIYPSTTGHLRLMRKTSVSMAFCYSFIYQPHICWTLTGLINWYSVASMELKKINEIWTLHYWNSNSIFVTFVTLIKYLQNGIQTCDWLSNLRYIYFLFTIWPSPEPLRYSTLDTPSPGFIRYFNTSVAFNDSSVYNKFC